MSRSLPPPPRLLLGAGSLLGVSSASRDRTLEVGARFAEPESLAVTFSKALALGADGVLASPTRTLRAALGELRHAVPVYALLPNVPEYVRDSSELGLIGAAKKRFRHAGFGSQVRMGLTGLAHFPGVLRGDFAALVPLLLQLEAAWLGAGEVRGIVLAAPLTDLALAGKHRRFFDRICRFVRGRFRASAGFETRNLGSLLDALDEWKVTPDFVIGPVNPRGLLMKPSPAEALASLRRTSVTVLAQELRAGGCVPLTEGARYAIKSGAKGLVADLVDLDEASELKDLRSALDERAAAAVD